MGYSSATKKRSVSHTKRANWPLWKEGEDEEEEVEEEEQKRSSGSGF